MFLTAIIIDDEQKGIDAVNILIKRYVDGLKVIAESTTAVHAIEMIENYRPDIVFLDINMPEMNGFDLLEKLEWRKFDLIFVTAHEEYALKALKANAIDYLLKPIDYEELVITITKIKKRKSEDEALKTPGNYSHFLNDIFYESKNKITIPSKAGIEAIDLAEIIFLESKSNYTQIYLNNSKIVVVAKTLKEFENMLDSNQNFMRVHHSFIVNLSKVLRFLRRTDIIIMTDNQSIPVSKRKKENFLKWLSV